MTGLTSNPTIFDHAIKNSTAYDQRDPQQAQRGKSGENLFFELALEDLTQAADLFRPIHDRTDGVDGWVSLEVSPLLAHDTAEHDRGRQGAACAGGNAPISSSRFPAPRKACRRSRNRSSPACRST